MRECLGKYSCMSLSFLIAILNGWLAPTVWGVVRRRIAGGLIDVHICVHSAHVCMCMHACVRMCMHIYKLVANNQ